MNRATANQNRRTTVKRALAAMTVGAVTLLGVGVSSASAASTSTTAAAPTLTPQQVAQRVEPAIELVETDTTGSVRYYDVSVNGDALINWARQDSSLNAAGNMYDGPAWWSTRSAKYPTSFLSKGSGTTVDAELVSLGSGFNVTPDGYIVTNAHVATISKRDAENGFLDQSMQSVIDALTKNLETQLATFTWGPANTPLQVPTDEASTVRQIVIDYILSTAQFGDISTTVYAGGGPNISEDLVHKGQVARVVAAGTVFPGKDVALLKIEANDLPTVPLGDDTTLQTGDAVYATGYPGDATFDPSVVSRDVTAQPTLSAGTVSNRLQSSAADYRYIENTATINHGNSGGALVNAQGQVVGITTAMDSSTEAANGDNGGKFFYAVPTSVVHAFLVNNGVHWTASADQATFETALDLMTAQHYKAAVVDLKTVATDGFNTPYVQQYLQQANAAIAAGKDVPLPGSSSAMLPIAGGVAAVLVLAGAVIVFARRRRSTPTPSVPAAAYLPPTASMVPATTSPVAPVVSLVDPAPDRSRPRRPPGAWRGATRRDRSSSSAGHTDTERSTTMNELAVSVGETAGCSSLRNRSRSGRVPIRRSSCPTRRLRCCTRASHSTAPPGWSTIAARRAPSSTACGSLRRC